MKKMFKIIIAIILILVICIYGALQILKPQAVQEEVAVYGDLIDTYHVQGMLMPQKSMLLNATMSGTVMTLPFKIGMAVEKNDELVIIAAANPAELEIQKQQLNQQLATAEYQYQQLFSREGQSKQAAALEAAQSAYDLAEEQYQAALAVEAELKGVYTTAQLNELESMVKAAYQALVAIESQNATTNDRNYYSSLISSIQIQLKTLEEEAYSEPLLAPFSGIVWQILTDEGSFLIKNQPVLKMYQSGAMKVVVSLLSEDALNLHLQEEAFIQLNDGTQYSAAVSFISPVAEQEMSSLGLMENRCTVELEPDNLPQNLGAGHQLDVVFSQLLAKNTLSVPASALFPLAGGSGLYIAINGKATLQQVQTGIKCGGRVEITSGLDPGATVIINPYESNIKNGNRVIKE
ncbi:MAG: HlyD family efflux transporter periplasmic adaptor subunit [Firmicutes bacterium]|nr:HlyD family efflux transporter periplasmic adaptor subunit [Bacillota bacterium]